MTMLDEQLEAAAAATAARPARPVAASDAREAPQVIGLDLSLTASGLSDGSSTWLVRSTGHKGDDLRSRCRRLRVLRDDICDRVEPEVALVLIEGPSFGQARQGGQHDRAGLWWLVVEKLRWNGHEVVEVPPACLKRYATGKGNANKGAMIDATARRFPDVDTAADDNRCDALWLAAMGLDHLGLPPVVMPAVQRESLERVAWPVAA